MEQNRVELMNKEAFRLYPTFVQEREIFRRGFEYADTNPDPELKKQWLEKAVEWIGSHYMNYSGNVMGQIPFGNIDEMIKDFKKYMEDK